MKKWILGLSALLIIACGTLFTIQRFGNKCSEAESKIVSKEIGKELDIYKGVKVFNNGEDYVEDYGKNYIKDGYYYGLKWQCVEYVKRFYYDVKNHKMPDGLGHAKEFFDESVKQGEINKKRNLFQYRNGESIKPQADDLLVFNDTHYGHVAIVTEVTDKDIKIIQQNIYGKTRDSLKISVADGKYFVGGDSQRSPAGWLRKGGE
jgi:surface antigen